MAPLAAAISKKRDLMRSVFFFLKRGVEGGGWSPPEPETGLDLPFECAIAVSVLETKGKACLSGAQIVHCVQALGF